MQPEFVDRGGSLVFELVGPFAAVFVLRVFPFGADAAFEEVIVRFQGEFGGWGDVVLCGCGFSGFVDGVGERKMGWKVSCLGLRLSFSPW